MRAMLELHPSLADRLAGHERDFELLWCLGDTVIRDHGERRTTRFQRDGATFYLKRYGRPARRLFRSDETATAEKQALERAAAAGIAVPGIAGYGVAEDGRSLIVLEGLPDTVSLETLSVEWRAAPSSIREKRALIGMVADLARRLHDAGINHRDLYLPHFHVPRTDPTSTIWLIDLQRAQIRQRVPRRWRVKDIGGLWFSAMDAGLSRTDLLRFVASYSSGNAARAMREERSFWRAVERRALRTYARHDGVPLPPHLQSTP